MPLMTVFGLGEESAESTKQCVRAYKKFVEDYPNYEIDVKLCAFTSSEMDKAKKELEGDYQWYYRGAMTKDGNPRHPLYMNSGEKYEWFPVGDLNC